MNQLRITNEELCRDTEQLRLLSVFHYVIGALTALFCNIGLFHFCFGLAAINHASWLKASDGSFPPEFIGYLFAVVGGAVVIGGWITGALLIYSGRLLQKHRGRSFSIGVAGLSCLSMPLGTILGVFTIIILTRKSVIQLYASEPLSISHDDEEIWKSLEQKSGENQ